MFSRKSRRAARKPHPDPVTEARLQQILGLRRSVERQEAVAAEYLEHLASARREQEHAGRSYRRSASRFEAAEYEHSMQAQRDRIAAAQAGLAAAEQAIADAQQQIVARMDGLSEFDLACL